MTLVCFFRGIYLYPLASIRGEHCAEELYRTIARQGRQIRRIRGLASQKQRR